MAKKQTFTSKLSKKGSDFKYVKHIKSVTSEDTGHIKFLENMVRLEENENLDQALKRMEEESKQVLSFGETLEEAPVEEAPAEEESKDEAPAEESTEEPAEEPKEEAPVEEKTAEEAEPATEDKSAEEAEESSDK
jgi:ribosomal protein S21